MSLQFSSFLESIIVSGAGKDNNEPLFFGIGLALLGSGSIMVFLSFCRPSAGIWRLPQRAKEFFRNHRHGRLQQQQQQRQSSNPTDENDDEEGEGEGEKGEFPAATKTTTQRTRLFGRPRRRKKQKIVPIGEVQEEMEQLLNKKELTSTTTTTDVSTDPSMIQSKNLLHRRTDHHDDENKMESSTRPQHESTSKGAGVVSNRSSPLSTRSVNISPSEVVDNDSLCRKGQVSTAIVDEGQDKLRTQQKHTVSFGSVQVRHYERILLSAPGDTFMALGLGWHYDDTTTTLFGTTSEYESNQKLQWKPGPTTTTAAAAAAGRSRIEAKEQTVARKTTTTSSSSNTVRSSNPTVVRKEDTPSPTTSPSSSPLISSSSHKPTGTSSTTPNQQKQKSSGRKNDNKDGKEKKHKATLHEPRSRFKILIHYGYTKYDILAAEDEKVLSSKQGQGQATSSSSSSQQTKHTPAQQ